MGIRDQSLEATGAMFATFSIGQTPEGVDTLKDADIGKAVRATGNNQVEPTIDKSVVLGKLLDLTLTDEDNGKRVATVQIAGIMTLPIAGNPDCTVPQVGERILGAMDYPDAKAGYVRRAHCWRCNFSLHEALDLVDIARGTVISVNGKTECTLIL